MNILISPNTMKGSLDAAGFADAVEKGFRRASPVFNIRKVPVADGGDYTGPVLCRALGAKWITTTVRDPLGREVSAGFGFAGKTAVIEMASASGIRLLKSNELNPEKTNTCGTGQLVLAALEHGCNKIIIGAGGSATTDGGIGLLEAMGFSFLDQDNNPLPGVTNSLGKVKRVNVPQMLPVGLEIAVLSDVNNPLLGINGAAAVFGPQKGADPEMVKRIEAGLTNWIEILEQTTGKRLRDIPGMGAAGGISSGLVAFLNAAIVPGAEYILEVTGIDRHIGWADLVITGEGKLDLQSRFMKAPAVLAERVRNRQKPVVAICGTYQPEAAVGFDEVVAICKPPVTLEESITHAGKLVEDESEQLAIRHLDKSAEWKEWHHRLKEIDDLLYKNLPEEAAKLLDDTDGASLAGYWYLRGVLEQKFHHWGNAINHFRKCLEIDPGNLKATAGIEMCHNILNFWNPQQFNP